MSDADKPQADKHHHTHLRLLLYQTPNDTQLLPYERMISIALTTWFKLNGQELTVVEKTNAEQMSTTGVIPFVCNDDLIIPGDWILITNHFRDYHQFAPRPKDEFHELLIGFVYQALVHMCWCEQNVYDNFTSFRYMNCLKWPIDRILCWSKKRKMIKICSSREIHFNDNTNHLLKVLKAIDDQLSTKLYIGDTKPNETDALLYGFLKAIVDANKYSVFTDYLPKLDNFDNLHKHIESMNKWLSQN